MCTIKKSIKIKYKPECFSYSVLNEANRVSAFVPKFYTHSVQNIRFPNWSAANNSPSLPFAVWWIVFNWVILIFNVIIILDVIHPFSWIIQHSAMGEWDAGEIHLNKIDILNSFFLLHQNPDWIIIISNFKSLIRILNKSFEIYLVLFEFWRNICLSMVQASFFALVDSKLLSVHLVAVNLLGAVLECHMIFFQF